MEQIENQHSQLGQDLWILESTNFKNNGYFIDIGAYDGIFHSNTYLLEKYGWTGICVEPSSKFNELLINRKCQVCNLIAYSESNLEIDFYETQNNLELSGIPYFFKNDGHENSRTSYITYKKTTITLTDLCDKYKYPSIIDYLSIDTEGSELHILQNHDFNKYKFQYITIEHNRSHTYKQQISFFLKSKGYELDNSDRFLNITTNIDTNFDDWYVYKGSF